MRRLLHVLADHTDVGNENVVLIANPATALQVNERVRNAEKVAKRIEYKIFIRLYSFRHDRKRFEVF